MKKFVIGLISVIAVVSVIGNVLLYMRYSSSRPLIKVNDQVIRRKDLDDRLDYLYTTNALKQMIVTSIILQAAQKANCLPSDAEVAQAKEQMQRTTPQVIADAKKTDPTLAVFNQQLEANLALRNLRVKDVKVSDSDAQAFYAAHKDAFRLPAQSQTTVVLAKDRVGADTAERLLQNGVSPEVVAQENTLRVVGINAPPINGFPPSISGTVLTMKKGAVRSFPVGSNFVIIRINSVASAGVPPYASIVPQVELAAKLAKAPTANAVLTKLVEDAQIKVESDRYASAVPTVSQNADASAK